MKVLSLDFGHLHPHIGLDVPYNKLRNIVLQRVNWPTYIQREHVKFNIQYLIKCASVIIIFLHHIHWRVTICRRDTVNEQLSFGVSLNTADSK